MLDGPDPRAQRLLAAHVQRVDRAAHSIAADDAGEQQPAGCGAAAPAAAPPSSEVLLPGRQKVWVKTFGCSHNSSDGEYMAGQLSEYGYRWAGGRRRRRRGVPAHA